MSKDRLANLDVFRAIAALSVCLFHFNRQGYIGVDALSSILAHGRLGVDIFFVISGFVIPLALEKSGFKIRDSFSFLAARFIRIYPAYFIAGLIALLLSVVSAMAPGYRGPQPSFSLGQIVGNIFLTCEFQKEEWLIPVFWTLAIEAQYYLAIALSFPGLVSHSRSIRYLTVLSWIMIPLLVPEGPTVFPWLSLFAMGVLCFMVRSHRIPKPAFWIMIVMAGVSHFMADGISSAIAGSATALGILFLPEIRAASLVWTGTISSSLYLIHIPLGGKILNLAERLPEHPVPRMVAILIALAVSLIASAFFFRFIEKPSHQWARKVRRRPTVIPILPPAPALAALDATASPRE